MAKTFARVLYVSSLFFVLSLATGAFGQTPPPVFFTPGDLVVAVQGCGIWNGGSGNTCSPVGGTGATTGTGSGTYGDDQAAPYTLFEFSCPGECTDPTSLGVTYVNALSLPTVTSGANLPISNDYGSQSEGTVQLSGDGVYLTMLGIGINAADFNVNPSLYCENYTSANKAGLCAPENGNPAAAQSVSLLGQSLTAVPRVAALIDAYGNVNTSTVLYNIFDQNDPRSAYLLSSTGTNIYVSGQGCKTCDGTGENPNLGWYDNTAGVYLTTVGITNDSPTAITGPDNGAPFTGSVTDGSPTVTAASAIFSCSPSCTSSPDVDSAISGSGIPSGTTISSVQSTTSATMSADATKNESSKTIILSCTTTSNPACDSSSSTRMVQIYNNTLYVSQDDTAGYNRSYIGTLGDPASTSLFTCTGVGGGCGTGYGPYGPAEMTGFGNTGGTGKVTITAGANGNGLNVTTVTCSTTNASATLTCSSGPFSAADVGDTVVGTGIPSGTTISAYTSSTTVTMSNNASATGSASISLGLLINLSPQNFYFASPTVLYVADTGSPHNTSNNDTICSTDGGGSTSVGDGGLQKWINISTTFTGSISGHTTVTAMTSTFSYLDVGLPIVGTGITAGTTIASVTSPTVATLSKSATNASNLSLAIGPAWSLAYTLYNGLSLVLNADCDTNTATSPIAPGAPDAATGLYGLAGVVNGGVATLYATSYPNDDLVQSYLWAIQDTLSTTAYPGTEFTLVATAPTGSLFRGVSFAPSAPTSGEVEITSSPSGATITTQGTGCDPGTITTPLTEAWTPNSSCTLSVTSPQTPSTGVQYTLSQWQDGTTGTSDVVTAPTGTATYTATFTTQYQLTTSAASGGTVSSGGYISAGTNATITATPSAGNCLVNFTAAALEGYAPVAASTSNPFTLAMNAPESITANFAAAGITSPTASSTLSSNAVTFSWNACAASAYYLDLGPMEGTNTYLDSGDLSPSTTSYSVTSLPTDGSTVWARFYTEVNGTWSYIDSSYAAYNSSVPPSGDGTATLTSPTAGSMLSGSSVTFSWSAGTNAYAYYLDVGTSSTPNQYYSQNEGTAQSQTVPGLPTNGSMVVVTLYTQFSSGGTWYYNTYNFNALNPSADQATLTSPTGPSLPDSIVTFDWSTGTGAYAYYLDVGTASNVNLYFSQNEGTAQSQTVSGLPTTGGEVVVTLYTQFTSGGTWYPLTYDFNALNAAADQATLSSPTPGSTLPGSSVTFTWSTGTGAVAYYLDVGTSSNLNLYYSANEGTATSQAVSDLPTNGSGVVVTLYTQFSTGGPWYANTYDFTAQ